MLGVKSLDYNNYYAALKGNYRKGVHRFRTILANPQLAQEFAQNVGGVSVVLGWPIGHDDKNSRELLTMLLAHEVLTAATLTWLSQWYPEDTDSADTLMDDATRCGEIKADALMWRAVTANPELVGKLAVTLAGLDCSQYADIAAAAASSTVMAAIIAAPAALNAVVSSSTAMAAVAASQTAMAAIIANSTALNAVVSSQTAMAAVVASSTAMAAVAKSPAAVAAIWKSTTAVQKVQANSTAWATFTGVSSAVIGKAAAILAGLNPDSYADMTAVAASSTAMAAVAASQTAMAAIIANSTALNAVVSSQTAMAAVVASSTAMAAVAGSSVAMQAVIANSAALNKVVASSTAMAAVAASSTAMAAVATNTSAMKAVASSPAALNAICKNANARSAFIGSKFRDTYYSQILTSLQNTTYFTARTTGLASGQTSSWDTNYYINGSSYAANTTGTKTADASFCTIEKAYAESSSHSATIVTLQGSVTILSTTSTSQVTKNFCIPGGFIYRNANFTNCKVYSAK